MSLTRLAGILALSASLASCGSLHLFDSSDSDSESAAPAQPSAAGGFLNNLAMGGPPPEVSPKDPPVQARFPDAVKQEQDFDCPILEVSANGAALRDFGGGGQSGAQALRHQISITRLARECKDAGSSIAMKLGVEGSVLLGPSGSPGSFQVPLVFEARLKDKVVASRRETLSVTIPPNEERAFYSTVVPDFLIPKDDDVEVYVGLNQAGGTELAPPRHHKRRRTKHLSAVAR